MNVTSKTRILVESAMLIAMAMVLSYVKIYELPQGGSITLEMLPIVVLALRHGVKTGCFGGFVFGLLQMILGFSNVLYCQTLIAMIGCILLDYLVAFTVLGLAPLFTKLSSNKVGGYIAAGIAAGVFRFICSFLSGWLLWGSYAPEGMGAFVYSLTYNASYMIPNTIILAAVLALLAKMAPKVLTGQE